MDAELLRQYLEFYQDLGIKTLFRRGAAPSPTLAATATSTPTATQTSRPTPMELPPLAPSGDTLLKIIEDIGDCRRCRLHEGRNKLVFGVGHEKASLVFVGEGPGADEDASGIPFVGRAGQLLTQMIENTAKKEGIPLTRADVYICNVVKCRPPGNRQPEPDEVEKCSPFLFRQLDALQPKVIVCLGATAAQTLLQTNRSISQFRGQWLDFRGYKMLPTYHPAYLLRNPAAKGEVWRDLQKVMAELGLEVKKNKAK